MNEAGKNDAHLAVLCLGSNIQPETNLRKAILLLKERAEVSAISTAWETQAVGAPGDPNYLNACVSLITRHTEAELTDELIRPIEITLGRVRSEDKSSPRTIDIDLVMYDGKALRPEYWEEAFMLVPLGELFPRFIHPMLGQDLTSVGENARKRIWILPRPEVLKGL